MLPLKTKEKRELLKWSKQNNPLMFLVLTMDGKWDTEYDDDENVCVHFLKCWPAVKEELAKRGTPQDLDEIDMDYPDDDDLASDALLDFINLLYSMPDYFEGAKRYADGEAFCRDLLPLFIWDQAEIDELWGHIGFFLDRQDQIEARDELFSSREMTETMAQYYSLCFLERGDADRAEEIMSPFRDSEDDVTEARFAWIDDIRQGRNNEE